MNFNQELIQSQRLSLKLSPQMVQSINLLTMPVFELRERILEEAEKNPALEIVSDSALDATSANYPSSTEFYTAKDTSDYYKSKDASTSFLQFLENQPAKEETLQEHLLAQLSEIKLSQDERLLAESIIQNLDDNGFHFVAPEILYKELLDVENLNDEQKAQLEHILNIVRNFDPTGTAFENAHQSLLFQAEKQNAKFLVIDILKNHFEKLSNMRVSTFQKLYPKHSTEEISNAFEFIKTLDPFPAREFGSSNVQFIVPDVHVYKIDSDSSEIDDRFAVISEERDLPVLRLAPLFLDVAENQNDMDKEESTFVKKQLKEAEWFLNGLGRRKQTLVKVTKEIVRRQKAFFLGFASAPSPLRMSEVAQALEIHEATVSRITAGKYLQCNFGIFPLRYFFTNAAVSTKEKNTKETGKVFSKEEVKQRLLLIIEEAEKEGKKLSDEKLSKMLAEYGMSIARRTVSKYRAELNIQSSYDR
ncbi:MAG: RNA polymerase factor sigma-54 [Treponema sp.]|jgi:RNA polymerase sigma-54 factor|nr:RNA polymerase factor sigma-54 [Treponema sp.]